MENKYLRLAYSKNISILQNYFKAYETAKRTNKNGRRFFDFYTELYLNVNTKYDPLEKMFGFKLHEKNVRYHILNSLIAAHQTDVGKYFTWSPDFSNQEHHFIDSYLFKSLNATLSADNSLLDLREHINYNLKSLNNSLRDNLLECCFKKYVKNQKKANALASGKEKKASILSISKDIPKIKSKEISRQRFVRDMLGKLTNADASEAFRFGNTADYSFIDLISDYLHHPRLLEEKLSFIDIRLNASTKIISKSFLQVKEYCEQIASYIYLLEITPLPLKIFALYQNPQFSDLLMLFSRDSLSLLL